MIKGEYNNLYPIVSETQLCYFQTPIQNENNVMSSIPHEI